MIVFRISEESLINVVSKPQLLLNELITGYNINIVMYRKDSWMIHFDGHPIIIIAGCEKNKF